MWTNRTGGKRGVEVVREQGGIEDGAGARRGIGDIDIDIMTGTRMKLIGVTSRDQGRRRDTDDIGHDQEAGEVGETMIGIQDRAEKGAVHLSIGGDTAENVTMRGVDKGRFDVAINPTAFVSKINNLTTEKKE